jgi:hypothetical protein
MERGSTPFIADVIGFIVNDKLVRHGGAPLKRSSRPQGR